VRTCLGVSPLAKLKAAVEPNPEVPGFLDRMAFFIWNSSDKAKKHVGCLEKRHWINTAKEYSNFPIRLGGN
jgi:hypothetical protein